MAKRPLRRSSRTRGKEKRSRAAKRQPTPTPGRSESVASEFESLPTVVAVGASAGGLEALIEILEHLPPRPNIAIIFVQQLSPEHLSALVELLSPKTSMTVVQAANGMSIEADHVYVIPPNAHMDISDGRLHLL